MEQVVESPVEEEERKGGAGCREPVEEEVDPVFIRDSVAFTERLTCNWLTDFAVGV